MRINLSSGMGKKKRFDCIYHTLIQPEIFFSIRNRFGSNFFPNKKNVHRFGVRKSFQSDRIVFVFPSWRKKHIVNKSKFQMEKCWILFKFAIFLYSFNLFTAAFHHDHAEKWMNNNIFCYLILKIPSARFVWNAIQMNVQEKKVVQPKLTKANGREKNVC